MCIALCYNGFTTCNRSTCHNNASRINNNIDGTKYLNVNGGIDNATYSTIRFCINNYDVRCFNVSTILTTFRCGDWFIGSCLSSAIQLGRNEYFREYQIPSFIGITIIGSRFRLRTVVSTIDPVYENY